MLQTYNIGEEVLYNGDGFDEEIDFEQARRALILTFDKSCYEIKLLDGRKSGKIIKISDLSLLHDKRMLKRGSEPFVQQSHANSIRWTGGPSFEDMYDCKWEGKALFFVIQESRGLVRRWIDMKTNMVRLYNWDGTIKIEASNLNTQEPHHFYVAKSRRPTKKKESYMFKGHQIDRLEHGCFEASKATILAIKFLNPESATKFYDTFLEIAGIHNSERSSRISSSVLRTVTNNHHRAQTVGVLGSKLDWSTTRSDKPSMSSILLKPASTFTLNPWICEHCTFENTTSKTQCEICESNRGGATDCPRDSWLRSINTANSMPLPPPFPPSEAPKDNIQKGIWTCDKCTLDNQAVDSECAACKNPKPITFYCLKCSTHKSSPCDQCWGTTFQTRDSDLSITSINSQSLKSLPKNPLGLLSRQSAPLWRTYNNDSLNWAKDNMHRESSPFLTTDNLQFKRLSSSSLGESEDDLNTSLEDDEKISSGDYDQAFVMAAQTIALNSTGTGIHPEKWLQTVMEQISEEGSNGLEIPVDEKAAVSALTVSGVHNFLRILGLKEEWVDELIEPDFDMGEDFSIKKVVLKYTEVHEDVIKSASKVLHSVFEECHKINMERKSFFLRTSKKRRYTHQIKNWSPDLDDGKTVADIKENGEHITAGAIGWDDADDELYSITLGEFDSIVFSQDGKNKYAVVLRVSNPVEYPSVRQNDKVISVDEESVRDWDFEKIISLLKDILHSNKAVKVGFERSIAEVDLVDVRQLIWWSTHENFRDKDAMNAFLLSHRAFVKSTELFDGFRERFYTRPPDDLHQKSDNMMIWLNARKRIRNNVTQLIKLWIKDFYQEDFAAQPELLTKVNQFIHEILGDTEVKSLGVSISRALKTAATRNKPKDDVKPNEQDLKLDFDHIDPYKIADQLCLLDLKTFVRIRPRELTKRKWKDKSRNQTECPNVMEAIKHHTRLTNFVKLRISGEASIQMRARTMKRYVKVMLRCIDRNNLSGAYALYLAIEHARVSFKYAWVFVKKKYAERYFKIKPLFDTGRNYKNMRRRMNMMDGASVPYIGIFFQDLNNVEEALKDRESRHRKGKLINFNKCLKTYTLIRNIQMFQQQQYRIKPNVKLERYLVAALESVGGTKSKVIWERTRMAQKNDETEQKKKRWFSKSNNKQ